MFTSMLVISKDIAISHTYRIRKAWQVVAGTSIPEQLMLSTNNIIPSELTNSFARCFHEAAPSLYVAVCRCMSLYVAVRLTLDPGENVYVYHR